MLVVISASANGKNEDISATLEAFNCGKGGICDCWSARGCHQAGVDIIKNFLLKTRGLEPRLFIGAESGCFPVMRNLRQVVRDKGMKSERDLRT